jgi:Tfp pilus assembly protein FimT
MKLFRSSKASDLTRIELLMVIAIIAILPGILFAFLVGQIGHILATRSLAHSNRK